MNLVTMRRILLEQIRPILEGELHLRYCMECGGALDLLDVPPPAAGEPSVSAEEAAWTWNVCLGDGAAPGEEDHRPFALWEVLECRGAPEAVRLACAKLVALFVEHWKIESSQLRLVVAADLGWNGAASSWLNTDPEVVPRAAAVADLRHRAARVQDGEMGGTLNLHLRGDEPRGQLCLQFEPHRLFGCALSLEDVHTLPPCDRLLAAAAQVGLDIDPAERESWIRDLRTWAQLLNHEELSGRPAQSAIDALRQRLEPRGSAGEGSGRKALDGTLAGILDGARALEDELCAVILAARDGKGADPPAKPPAAAELGLASAPWEALEEQEPTEFVGADQDACETRVLRLLAPDGRFVDQLEAGQGGWLVVQRSCFFGRPCGVDSDRGEVQWIDGKAVVLEVESVRGTLAHAVRIERGCLRAASMVDLLVASSRRRAIERNFSAAAALVAHLGGRAGTEPDIDRLQITPRGFEIGLWAESVALRGEGPDELEELRQSLEDELSAWILEAQWIDPAESAPRGQRVISIGIEERCEGGDAQVESAPRHLLLGSLGWVRTDAVAVPNSAYLALVHLERLAIEDAGVLVLRGAAGAAAIAAVRELERRAVAPLPQAGGMAPLEAIMTTV